MDICIRDIENPQTDLLTLETAKGQLPWSPGSLSLLAKIQEEIESAGGNLEVGVTESIKLQDYLYFQSALLYKQSYKIRRQKNAAEFKKYNNSDIIKIKGVWSKQEVEYLKNNFGIASKKTIIFTLQRRWSSIIDKANSIFSTQYKTLLLMYKNRP